VESEDEKTPVASLDDDEGVGRIGGAEGGFEVTWVSKAARVSFCRMFESQSDLPVEITTYCCWVNTALAIDMNQDVPVYGRAKQTRSY